MRAWFAALPLFLVACGTPCERERDLARARAEDCGVEVVGDTDTSGTCPDESAVLADCLIPCFRHVPCGAFDGSDADAMIELQQCQSDCMFPEAP